MFFLGMAVHLISADAGQILFLEEPETGIHPRRLGELVDLLRVVADAGRQVVLSTHSPTLLDYFRDVPESIVLFRRGPNGSRVKRLSEVDALMRALEEHDGRPGGMLADGFFHDGF